ncbi:hypothetical protein [Ruania halotolerans]|uniref:hypothetical protein n=1 Tax=Ruania halotolerans TaxID=2897773 RepID=UPI001E5ACD9F|nr:hypothetical protein [Ruania halotolerans]UFU07907.1 hypothetical protein LQF10_07365 [Ruania halotolerans]
MTGGDRGTPPLVRRSPPAIAGYSLTAFVVPLLIVALALGPPILLGLEDVLAPRGAGEIYAAAVVLCAVPLLRLCTYELSLTLDTTTHVLTVERRFWWGRRVRYVPVGQVERWYTLESMGMVVLRLGVDRPVRLWLHTPQSSPNRRPRSVELTVAWLQDVLGERRDAAREPAASRRAKRLLISSVLAGVVIAGSGFGWLLVAMI